MWMSLKDSPISLFHASSTAKLMPPAAILELQFNIVPLSLFSFFSVFISLSPPPLLSHRRHPEKVHLVASHVRFPLRWRYSALLPSFPHRIHSSRWQKPLTSSSRSFSEDVFLLHSRLISAICMGIHRYCITTNRDRVREWERVNGRHLEYW